MKTNGTAKTAGMKRMSLIAILAMVSLMPALAQQKPAPRMEGPRGPRPEIKEGERPKFEKMELTAESMALMKAKDLQRSLKLSDDQYNKVYKLYKKEFEAVEADKKAGKTPDEQQKKETKARVEKKMQKILNDAQFAEWKAMQQRPCCQHHQGCGQGGHAGCSGQGCGQHKAPQRK